MSIKAKVYTLQVNRIIRGIKIRTKVLALITIFKNDFDLSEYEAKQLIALV